MLANLSNTTGPANFKRSRRPSVINFHRLKEFFLERMSSINVVETKVTASVKSIFSSRATASYSIVIRKSPQELFHFLENVNNWVLFSFHGVFEVEQYLGLYKILSIWGPGTVRMSKSEKYGILDHTVTLYYEDEWSIYARITTHAQGALLNISIEKPGPMPSPYFDGRMVRMKEQLEKLSDLLD